MFLIISYLLSNISKRDRNFKGTKRVNLQRIIRIKVILNPKGDGIEGLGLIPVKMSVLNFNKGFLEIIAYLMYLIWKNGLKV